MNNISFQQRWFTFLCLNYSWRFRLDSFHFFITNEIAQQRLLLFSSFELGSTWISLLWILSRIFLFSLNFQMSQFSLMHLFLWIHTQCRTHPLNLLCISFYLSNFSFFSLPRLSLLCLLGILYIARRLDLSWKNHSFKG